MEGVQAGDVCVVCPAPIRGLSVKVCRPRPCWAWSGVAPFPHAPLHRRSTARPSCRMPACCESPSVLPSVKPLSLPFFGVLRRHESVRPAVQGAVVRAVNGVQDWTALTTGLHRLRGSAVLTCALPASQAAAAAQLEPCQPPSLPTWTLRQAGAGAAGAPDSSSQSTETQRTGAALPLMRMTDTLEGYLGIRAFRSAATGKSSQVWHQRYFVLQLLEGALLRFADEAERDSGLQHGRVTSVTKMQALAYDWAAVGGGCDAGEACSFTLTVATAKGTVFQEFKATDALGARVWAAALANSMGGLRGPGAPSLRQLSLPALAAAWAQADTGAGVLDKALSASHLPRRSLQASDRAMSATSSAKAAAQEGRSSGSTSRASSATRSPEPTSKPARARRALKRRTARSSASPIEGAHSSSSDETHSNPQRMALSLKLFPCSVRLVPLAAAHAAQAADGDRVQAHEPVRVYDQMGFVCTLPRPWLAQSVQRLGVHLLRFGDDVESSGVPTTEASARAALSAMEGGEHGHKAVVIAAVVRPGLPGDAATVPSGPATRQMGDSLLRRLAPARRALVLGLLSPASRTALVDGSGPHAHAASVFHFSPRFDLSTVPPLCDPRAALPGGGGQGQALPPSALFNHTLHEAPPLHEDLNSVYPGDVLLTAGETSLANAAPDMAVAALQSHLHSGSSSALYVSLSIIRPLSVSQAPVAGTPAPPAVQGVHPPASPPVPKPAVLSPGPRPAPQRSHRGRSESQLGLDFMGGLSTASGGGWTDGPGTGDSSPRHSPAVPREVVEALRSHVTATGALQLPTPHHYDRPVPDASATHPASTVLVSPVGVRVSARPVPGELASPLSLRKFAAVDMGVMLDKEGERDAALQAEEAAIRAAFRQPPDALPSTPPPAPKLPAGFQSPFKGTPSPAAQQLADKVVSGQVTAGQRVKALVDAHLPPHILSSPSYHSALLGVAGAPHSAAAQAVRASITTCSPSRQALQTQFDALQKLLRA